MRPDCDTITLKDGPTYHGLVTGMSQRVVKFINCDALGLPVITVYLKDVKTLNYNRIQHNLNKLRYQKEDVKEKEKENNIIKSLDTTKCIHFGIIPYQFLTRSSALYARYDLKNNTAIEYRPSYTYATNLPPNYLISPWYYDNFYFQGINNSFLFYFPQFGRTQIGLMLTYKHWWHGKAPIYNDIAKFGGSSYDYYLIENKSTVMNGLGLGLEFNHYRKTHKDFDFNFFWSFSLTYFSSYSHVYSVAESYGVIGYYINKTYPYTETKDRLYFNLTCGFKIGYKKKIK